MILQYQIEISGGIFPMKEFLKGIIVDDQLVDYVKQKDTSASKKSFIRDGQTYKFILATNGQKKEFTIDEFGLDDNLKKIMNIAQNQKK